MASPLAGLSPGQRQALMFGAPVVAVFALVSSRQKKAEAAAAAAAPPAATLPANFPSTDAIGTGQLAEFESGVTSALSQLQHQVDAQQGQLSADLASAIANIPPPAAVYVAPAPSTNPELAAAPPADTDRAGAAIGYLAFAGLTAEDVDKVVLYLTTFQSAYPMSWKAEAAINYLGAAGLTGPEVTRVVTYLRTGTDPAK
jgi:hypothetical protein